MLKQSLLWDFAGRALSHGTGIIISIFLARLLEPEDFALIAIILTFTSFLSVLVNAGLGSALIQGSDLSDKTISTVFWLNNTISIILFLLFWFSSDLVANFYENETLSSLIKYLSIVIIFDSLGIVQRSMLTRSMNFKSLSIIQATSMLVSGGIGVALAFSGAGVWALVYQTLCGSLITLIGLWIVSSWKPLLVFQKSKLRPLWSFGGNLFVSEIIQAICARLDVIVIGKIFQPKILGFYSRAKSLNELVTQYASQSLRNVLFPYLSERKTNISVVQETVIRFYHLASIVSLFLGGMIYLLSEDIIVILFGQKWLPSAPILQVIILSIFSNPLSAIILSPLKSLGHSGLFLKVEIIKQALYVGGLLIGFQFGLYGYLYAVVIIQFFGVLINGYYAGKHINWTLRSQLVAFSPYLFITILTVMLFTLTEPYMNQLHILFYVVIVSIAYVVVFFGLNYLFKTKGFLDLLAVIKSTFVKRS